MLRCAFSLLNEAGIGTCTTRSSVKKEFLLYLIYDIIYKKEENYGKEEIYKSKAWWTTNKY